MDTSLAPLDARCDLRFLGWAAIGSWTIAACTSLSEGFKVPQYRVSRASALGTAIVMLGIYLLFWDLNHEGLLFLIRRVRRPVTGFGGKRRRSRG